MSPQRSVLILMVTVTAVGCGRGKSVRAEPKSLRAVDASSSTQAAVPATSASRHAGAMDGPALRQGRQDYLRLCAACHGPEGRGYAADHAPSLVNPTFLESASDDFLKRSIASGRPGTSMGAYGKVNGGPLDDAALDNLTAFLRRQGPAPKRLKAPRAGDPKRGEAIYLAACKLCHGDAQTRGEAIHLANPEFLKQASDAFISHAVVNGRPGTKMLAFSATLTRPQIDDVVAFVRSFQGSQPGVALLPAPTGHEPMVLNPRGKDPTFQTRDGRFVGVEQVNQALREGRRLSIIDARPPSDWMRVHIRGAVSIPYHDLKRLDEVPAGVWAIAYCACPHHLSGDVVDALIKRGHKRALVLDEGINEWHRRGFPVTAARGVPVPASEPTAPPAAAASAPPVPFAAPRAVPPTREQKRADRGKP